MRTLIQDLAHSLRSFRRRPGGTIVAVSTIALGIAAVDPSPPLGSAQPLERVVSDSLRSRRFVLVLVGVFGAAALVLAGIGLFEVMACLVAQRTSELGVRLMLGRAPRTCWGWS